MKDEYGAAVISREGELSGRRLALRSFRDGDAAAIVWHADNPNVARYLRERFPQPYTRAAAAAWLESVTDEKPARNLAITVEDQVIGGIGLAPGTDIHRVSAEVGYWLGEAMWGQGIATCALRLFIPYALASFPVCNRLFAYVDEEHAASIRVLEKNGFRQEGRFVGAAVQRGSLRNQLVFGLTRGEVAVDSR